MPDSSTCKRTPSCCCIAATVVVIAILAISAPLAAQLLSGETPIPPGATGPIDLHKSLVDKMSLLSISQETEGSEGSTTPTWILVIILCGLTITILQIIIITLMTIITTMMTTITVVTTSSVTPVLTSSVTITT